MDLSKQTPQTGPGRSHGHYSADLQRWWDGGKHRWFPVSKRVDTLEIDLEDCAGTPWLQIRRGLEDPDARAGTYRFVGVAHSEGRPAAGYRIFGDTFSATPDLLRTMQADRPWPLHIQGNLNNLCAYLHAHGWIRTDHGAYPWSRRYRRPCIDTAAVVADAQSARANGEH